MLKKMMLAVLLCLAVTAGFAATADEYYQAGLTLYQQQNDDMAVKYFTAAVQTDPNHWQSYQGMGHAYYRMGKAPEALGAYERCLALNPDNAPLKGFVDQLKAQGVTAPAAETAAAPAAAKSAAAPAAPRKKMRFGPKAGFQMTNLKAGEAWASSYTSAELSQSGKACPAFGLMMVYELSPKLSLSPEILYSSKAHKYTQLLVDDLGSAGMTLINTWDGEGSSKLNFVQIPILFRFYPTKGHNLNVIVGPSANINMGGTWEDNTHYTLETNAGMEIDETYSESGEISEGYKKLEFSAIAGLSYQAGSLVVDARYDLGLTDLSEYPDVMSVKSSAMGVFLGYLF